MNKATAKRLAELHRLLAEEYERAAGEEPQPEKVATPADLARAREKGRRRFLARRNMQER